MREIQLTQGYVAVVDDADYERVAQFNWCAEKQRTTVYAVRAESRRSPGRRHIYMHRFITDTPAGLQVDHQDKNGLNNQRSNLRICTRAENQRNRGRQLNNKSGYKGVCWSNKDRKWQVNIAYDRQRLYLGQFSDLKEAAQAYERAAKELHAEFARLE